MIKITFSFNFLAPICEVPYSHWVWVFLFKNLSSKLLLVVALFKKILIKRVFDAKNLMNFTTKIMIWSLNLGSMIYLLPLLI